MVMERCLESDFVGREEELKEVAEIFKKNRILGIFGKKGIGKSRLALKLLETEGKVELIHCNFNSVRKLDGVLKLLTTCILKQIPEILLEKRNEADDDDDDFVDETRCIMDDIVNKMNEEPSKCYLLLLDNLEFAKSKADKDGKKADIFQRCLWDKVYNHIVPPFLEKCEHTQIVITSAEQANILRYNPVYGKYRLRQMSPGDAISLFRSQVQGDDKELIGQICELCDYQPDNIINAGHLVVDEGFTIEEAKDLLGVKALETLSTEFITWGDRPDVCLKRTVTRLSTEDKEKLCRLVAVIAHLPNMATIDNCLKALGYEKEHIAQFKFKHVMPFKNRFLIDVERMWKLRVPSFLRLFLEEHKEFGDLEENVLKRIKEIVGKEDTKNSGTDDIVGTESLPLTSTADQHAKLHQQEFQDIPERQGERQFSSDLHQGHNPLVPSALQQETDIPPDKCQTQTNNVVLPMANHLEDVKSSMVTSFGNVANEDCKCPQPETVHVLGPGEKHFQENHSPAEISEGAEASSHKLINVKSEKLRSGINFLNQDSGIKRITKKEDMNILKSVDDNSNNDVSEPHTQSSDLVKMQHSMQKELPHTDNDKKLENIGQNDSVNVRALDDEGSVRCLSSDENLHIPSSQPEALSLPQSLLQKDCKDMQQHVPLKPSETDNEIDVDAVCKSSDLSDSQTGNHVTALSDYQSGPYLDSRVDSHNLCSELHAMPPLSSLSESAEYTKRNPPLQFPSMNSEKLSFNLLSSGSDTFDSHENMQLRKHGIRDDGVENGQIPLGPQDDIVSSPQNADKSDLQVDKNIQENLMEPDNNSTSIIGKFLSWITDSIE